MTIIYPLFKYRNLYLSF
jgi:hypothetical protein